MLYYKIQFFITGITGATKTKHLLVRSVEMASSVIYDFRYGGGHKQYEHISMERCSKKEYDQSSSQIKIG